MEEEGRAEKQCGSLRYSTLSSRVSKAEEEGKEVIQLKGIRHSEPYTRILPTITISSQVQPTVPDLHMARCGGHPLCRETRLLYI